MRYLMCVLILIGGLALPEFVGSEGQANVLIENQRQVEAIEKELRILRQMVWGLVNDAHNARKQGRKMNMQMLLGVRSARHEQIIETVKAYKKALVATGVQPKAARLRAQSTKEIILAQIPPPPCK